MTSDSSLLIDYTVVLINLQYTKLFKSSECFIQMIYFYSGRMH